MRELSLFLPDAAATDALGAALAARLAPGDTLLLGGTLGAGKSSLARAIIRSRLAAEGRVEDIPSPTFTLVQVYETEAAALWHCDLYRLGHADELIELGLDEAFDSAICLIEWPERLGNLRPARHLAVALSDEGEGRRARLTAAGAGWAPLLGDLGA
ncbi:tRNA (adenosine(37)-N6)-threonylcarbamoyltransferase complex ATPase subunit type 1 TsaE [Paroceanicella profunda]|uniref:tRNA threonylcarbamoyladenosine biosynthesis protein TsaE n=1 Tax=Paroceanicella profunda TaxID=2579971 RepID=A0A5B8FH48_9RHOB|nr:tRNA (adenosine(37)-N6)-threonylcarbamoyltransferase complex ATPase subunit type 1 TsaE [Paroceanicella profunda]QDL91777.1 tRNA (adenosine(37)-N6)-threonylcarbamoyltransferase complex ATPase subunit type 1 TsaE [Paroceanicella profunda]